MSRQVRRHDEKTRERRVSRWLLTLVGVLSMMTAASYYSTPIGAGDGEVAEARPSAVNATPTPRDDDDEEDKFVVVKAGRIITMAGDDVENGMIVIRNGKIEAVGKEIDYPFGAEVIDAPNMVVMPGMIHPASRFAFVPRGRGTMAGLTFEKQFRVDPDRYEVALAAGYTTLAMHAQTGGVGGRELIIRTAGEKPEDLIVEAKGPVAMSIQDVGRQKPLVLRAFDSAKKEIEKVEKARKKWEEQKKKAEAEAKKKKAAKKPAPKPSPKPGPKPTPTPKPKPGPKPKPKPAPKKPTVPKEFVAPPMNPMYTPLVDLIQKKEGKTAVVEIAGVAPSPWASGAGAAGTYLHWLEVLEKYDFDHSYVFRNGKVTFRSAFFVMPETDLENVAEKLGERKARVALYPLLNDHPYTQNRYCLGNTFRNAGCEVVFIPENENATSSWLDMRFNLARMVRAGFPRDEILETVTVNAARMIGMEDRFGSIQKGRDANIVFLTGDPFAFDTRVEKVMIDGKVAEFRKLIY